jgi:hypothetical protein
VPTTMISSTIALVGYILADKLSFFDSVVTWLTWWFADAAGTLYQRPETVTH